MLLQLEKELCITETMKRTKFYWIYKHKIDKGVRDDMRTVTIFINTKYNI